MHSLIKGFKSYLLLEKSLADNSIEAYIRDVQKLETFAAHLIPTQILEKLNTEEILSASFCILDNVSAMRCTA